MRGKLKKFKSKKSMEKWHLWFAWYPIFINVGNPDPTITFVWLEKVYRKREYTLSYNGYNWEWNYTREYRIFNRG